MSAQTGTKDIPTCLGAGSESADARDPVCRSHHARHYWVLTVTRGAQQTRHLTAVTAGQLFAAVCPAVSRLSSEADVISGEQRG